MSTTLAEQYAAAAQALARFEENRAQELETISTLRGKLQIEISGHVFDPVNPQARERDVTFKTDIREIDFHGFPPNDPQRDQICLQLAKSDAMLGLVVIADYSDFQNQITQATEAYIDATGEILLSEEERFIRINLTDIKSDYFKTPSTTNGKPPAEQYFRGNLARLINAIDISYKRIQNEVTPHFTAISPVAVQNQCARAQRMHARLHQNMFNKPRAAAAAETAPRVHLRVVR